MVNILQRSTTTVLHTYPKLLATKKKNSNTVYRGDQFESDECFLLNIYPGHSFTVKYLLHFPIEWSSNTVSTQRCEAKNTIRATVMKVHESKCGSRPV